MQPVDIKEERRAHDPMDFNDLKELGDAYLAHHGVEGQQWGVQNGPPYPLEGKGKRNFIKQAREARQKRRRKKILKDPEKIVKYQDEFTPEEIDEALKKIDKIIEVKKRIPKKETLTGKEKRHAKTPADLLKNLDKFDADGAKMALERLKKQREIQEMMIDDAKRPAKILGIGNSYLNEITSGVGNVKNLTGNIIGAHDNFMLIGKNGQKYQDQYNSKYGKSGGGVSQDKLDDLIDKIRNAGLDI